ncbi:MAG: hypothetical protein EOP50_06575 [Sphingobacteriales bacterium]|nr:MAG: hypothetical protein EOP50_06575 [Sphingobacteriales bacterium]
MKHIFLFTLLFIAAAATGQSLTGLYSGTLRNDTTGLVQQYELSITQEGNKVVGYSHTTFVLDNRMHFGFRKVKGMLKDGKLFVEESDMLENNFPVQPPKGIRRTSVFPLYDGRPYGLLEGKWMTNATRQWAPATGTLSLKKKGDSSNSALVAKFKEFYPPKVPATPPLPPKPLSFSERKNQTVQSLSISADSVEIALYDNGLVDGDSISVYLNGQVLLQHVRLSENAFRYTVLLKPGTNELSLLAENLGSIAPNTGLLVLRNGDSRHNIYFSADLQTNARIEIKKP